MKIKKFRTNITVEVISSFHTLTLTEKEFIRLILDEHGSVQELVLMNALWKNPTKTNTSNFSQEFSI